MATVLAATDDGLHSVDVDGLPGPSHHNGRPVTGLGRARSDLWALIGESEVWRGSGDEWTHVADISEHRGSFITGIAGHIFVGTSEARLFLLAGDALEPLEAFDKAEGRSTWYTPWGGPAATRSMANWDEDLFVNVHVGGILTSSDRGASWAPTIDIQADVHHVTTAEGMVLAACARGLAVSNDGGTTWRYRTDGLEDRYSRAVAVCGDVVLVSASAGPRGGHAAVYRAALPDGTFERCRTGLPEWFEDNIDTYCLDALPDGAFAAFGTRDGLLFGSNDSGGSWRPLASGLPPVRRVLVMP